MSAEQLAPVSAPDGIEPVEAWRSWNLSGSQLVSLNGATVWPAGEPLRAACAVQTLERRWVIVKRGCPLVDAQNFTANWNRAKASPYSTGYYLERPRVEPPPGYGYELLQESHEAPSASCTCGIYAVKAEGDVPSAAVRGKVKLWGKIVPGERGYRAEYAYPSELRVPPELADHPDLLAYGVPIVVEERQRGDVSTDLALAFARQVFSDRFNDSHRNPFRWRLNLLWAAIGANLSACAWNLGVRLW